MDRNPQPRTIGQKLIPDYSKTLNELSRPGVTLQLLWEEYQSENPDGLGRTAFYEGFQKYRNKKDTTMAMIHKGGDKLFVDYSGDSFSYVDRTTGEIIKTELFVASWGASSYTYAEVTTTQGKEDWVLSHVRAFEYFGGLPQAVVPDNLKSAVTKPSLYEPDINPLYAKMAEHYDIAILPARVRKPQDKGVVESNVLCVQRRILASLRNRTFFSLAEINEAIIESLEAYNARGMKDYGNQSRKERFEALDAPCLKPLAERFPITSIKIGVRVQKNYHIEFNKYHYSCPHTLVGESVDVYQSGLVLEVYHKGEHVCRHEKKPGNYGYETKDEHMPKKHQYTKGFSASSFIFKGGEIGPYASELIKIVLENRRHPEQGFKAAQGVLRLEKKYDKNRVELACKRAVYFKSYSYKSVKSILEKGLEQELLMEDKQEAEVVLVHDNIRGSEYYQSAQAQGGE